jgi:hypothetical protein
MGRAQQQPIQRKQQEGRTSHANLEEAGEHDDRVEPVLDVGRVITQPEAWEPTQPRATTHDEHAR